jgi:hypothetical protein
MTTAVENEHSGPGPDFDARCRAYYLAQDRSVYYTGMVLLSMPILLFSYSDYLLYGTGPKFELLAGVRLSVLAVTANILLLLPRVTRRPSEGRLIAI